MGIYTQECRDDIEVDQLERAYVYALTHELGELPDVGTVAERLEIPEPQLEAAIGRLTELGLLQRSPGRGLVAVSPDDAMRQMLGPQEREIRVRRARLEEQRQRLLSFTPAFQNAFSVRQKQQVELLDNLTEVRQAIAELSAESTREILTAQPGGARPENILVDAATRDYEALRRGVGMRVLYQHTARSSQGTQSYVEQITGLGAQVRTLHDQFTRFLVFDRKYAVFAVPDSTDAAALTQDPFVVSFMVETYERMWLTAEPFRGAFVEPKIDHEVKEAIVRLLTAGLTDTVVARRLGMSVRTCRRHVADIMATLDAESRFQAGYLLAAQDSSEPDAREPAAGGR